MTVKQGDDNGNRKPGEEVHSNPAGATNQDHPRITVTTRDKATHQIPSEGIRAGEVIGYRAWKVLPPQCGGGVVLRSLVVPYYWDYDKPAEGLPMKGEGLYAFKTVAHGWKELKDVVEQRNHYFDLPNAIVVLGSADMWGEIIEHELGYRTEFARVRKLDGIWPKCAENEELLIKLRKAYGI